MEARSVARYIRMSPRKIRRVLQLIKGMPLREARSLLDVMPHRAARLIRRVMDSAAANAENNHGMEADELWVAEAMVDAGPTMKRWRIASAGRIGMIRKRISHIRIVLSDEEPAQAGLRLRSAFTPSEAEESPHPERSRGAGRH